MHRTRTSDRICEIAEEIDAVLKAHRVPAPNRTVVDRLQFLANQLKPWDSYAGEKASNIVLKAEIFYSARKHWKYPGEANMLYTEMTFDLLNRIRGAAERRKQAGD